MVIDWQLSQRKSDVEQWLQQKQVQNAWKNRAMLKNRLQKLINEPEELKGSEVIFADLIEEHRQHGLFQPVQPLADEFLQEHCSEVLTYYAYLSQVISSGLAFKANLEEVARKACPRLRSFSLLPLRRMRRAHIPITNIVLKSFGFADWTEVLKPEFTRKKGKREFGQFISTDGLNVSLMMSRNVYVRQQAEVPVTLDKVTKGFFYDVEVAPLETKEEPTIVGLDPGQWGDFLIPIGPPHEPQDHQLCNNSYLHYS